MHTPGAAFRSLLARSDQLLPPRQFVRQIAPTSSLAHIEVLRLSHGNGLGPIPRNFFRIFACVAQELEEKLGTLGPAVAKLQTILLKLCVGAFGVPAEVLKSQVIQLVCRALHASLAGEGQSAHLRLGDPSTDEREES